MFLELKESMITMTQQKENLNNETDIIEKANGKFGVEKKKMWNNKLIRGIQHHIEISIRFGKLICW